MENELNNSSDMGEASPPVVTWRGACDPERHGSSDSWEVRARTEYAAAVQVRAQLMAQGRVMPADLDWTTE